MSGAVTTGAEELRLDILVRDLLGRETNGRVELLLDANPGLAAGGPYVAEGTVLALPTISAEPTIAASVNPWE